jgi:hypothetical protein
LSVGLKKKGAPDNGKYEFGMDVHKDAITIAVMNSAGKVIMESIIETRGGDHSAVYPRAARRYVCHV